MTGISDQKDAADKAAMQSAAAFIGDWLDYWFPRAAIPGLSVAIRHHGDLVLNKAWGHADPEKQEKLTTRHVFRAASHTKMFTATALGILRDRGLISFDDPVEKHVPWMKDSNGLGSLTLRQLLSHTAGLPRDTAGTDYWELDKAYVRDEEFKRQILQMEKVRENPVFKYSNVGFCLLGQVIEHVTGRNYLDFITDEIIRPLHLNETAAEFDRVPQGLLVTGHAPAVEGKSATYDPRLRQNSWESANAVCSTPSDMTDFMDRKGAALLSEPTRGELTREFARASDDIAYGLGHELIRVGNRVFTGHTGGYPGQSTYTLHSDELGLSVSIFSSTQSRAVAGLMDGIMKAAMYFAQDNHPQYRGVYASPNSAFGAAVTEEQPDLFGGTEPRLNLFSLTEADPFKSPFSFPQTGADRYKISGTGGFNFEDEDVVFARRDGTDVMTYATTTYKKVPAPG